MKPKPLIVAYIAGMIFWSLLSYGQLFEYVHEGVLFARTINGKPYISDFVNSYNAALLAHRCVLSAAKPNIYAPSVQDQSLRQLIAPVVPESPFYFQYPPYCFLLAMPLGLVSMPVAWCLWNLIFVSASIATMYFFVGGPPTQKKRIPVALALCTYPFWLSVELGQIALVILPLTILFFTFLKKKRYIAAGIATGLMAVKLQYLPAFGIIGLIVGKLPFVLAVALTLCILLLASGLVLGFDNVARFPAALMTYETGHSVSGVNTYMMQNLRGELWLFLHNYPHVLNAAAFAGMCIGLAALVWLWRRADNAGEDRFDQIAAASIIIMLLTSLHTHMQDYVLAVIPAIIWWQSKPSASTTQSSRDRALIVLLAAFPAFSWVFQFALPLFYLIFIQPFFVWALCLLVLVIMPKQNHADEAAKP